MAQMVLAVICALGGNNGGQNAHVAGLVGEIEDFMRTAGMLAGPVFLCRCDSAHPASTTLSVNFVSDAHGTVFTLSVWILHGQHAVATADVFMKIFESNGFFSPDQNASDTIEAFARDIADIYELSFAQSPSAGYLLKLCAHPRRGVALAVHICLPLTVVGSYMGPSDTPLCLHESGRSFDMLLSSLKERCDVLSHTSL